MGYGRLTERKIRYIVRHKRRGKRHKEYLPIKKRGRKVKELSEEEKEIIKEAKAKYKLGARRLERIIEQVYGIHIPHNRIHKFLLEEGLAKEEPRKKRRRKPYIRYEREYSMSAGHIGSIRMALSSVLFWMMLPERSLQQENFSMLTLQTALHW